MAHVDDFSRKELNRLIEPTAEDLQAGASYAIHTAVLLGHDYNRCIDLQREFDSEEMQKLLAARFRGQRFTIRTLSFIFVAILVAIAALAWAIKKEFTLWELSLFVVAVCVASAVVKDELGSKAKFETWKLSELRTRLVADIFQTERMFSDWFSRNQGNFDADPCREIRDSTGLPSAAVTALFAQFRMRHRDEFRNWVQAGIQIRRLERR